MLIFDFVSFIGPLPETVLDFWRMVWEQKVPVIVMLTKLLEDNRVNELKKSVEIILQNLLEFIMLDWLVNKNQN